MSRKQGARRAANSLRALERPRGPGGATSQGSGLVLDRRSDALLAAAAGPAHAVEPIESGGFIALGERRVIEHGIHEIVDLAAEGQHRLADVNQLASALADDVHAKQLARLP
jgi:hypothetical protein